MIRTYKSSRRGHLYISISLPYTEKQAGSWLLQPGFIIMAHLNSRNVFQLKVINSMDGSHFVDPDESEYQDQFTERKGIKNDDYWDK